MPRKPVAELTPEELEARRLYIREAVKKHRQGKLPEKDPRGYRGKERIAKQREKRKVEASKKD
jgi:hypothetical protein